MLLCENCHRELHHAEPVSNTYQVQKEKINNKRKQLLEILGCKCSQCGYDKHLSALTFHHLRDKKYNLTLREMASAIPMEKFISEVKKCIVLCENCHREIHNPDHIIDIERNQP
jgi:predicted HNH restriction endonuclease